MVEREQLLAALRAKLDRAVAVQDRSLLLDPGTFDQARQLAAILGDGDDYGDLQVKHMLGWLHVDRALQAAGPPPIAGGQAGHLLRERHLGARVAAAEEPAGLQVNKHFLAAARGIGQLPLVAGVHPPRYHAAPRAGCLAGAGPGQHTHRPARHAHALDGQADQVRNKDTENLKIARLA
jgi:hypothetical protein